MVQTGLLGKLIATGQAMSYYGSLLKAPIVMSDGLTLAKLHVFEGMTGDVTAVKFSPDSRFLAASDDSGKFTIWTVADRSVVSSRVYEKKLTSFAWGQADGKQKFGDYYIVSTNNQQVDLHRLTYDMSTMLYAAKHQPVQLPNTGLNRMYECCAFDAKHNYFFAATKGGEVCVFDVGNRLFKASVQAGKSAIRSIYLHQSSEQLFVGF